MPLAQVLAHQGLGAVVELTGEVAGDLAGAHDPAQPAIEGEQGAELAQDVIHPQQLGVFRRRDDVAGQPVHDRRHLVVGDVAPHVVEAVETEGGRIGMRAFVGEALGHRARGEADAVARLQHRPQGAADIMVLGLIAGVGQIGPGRQFHQPPRAKGETAVAHLVSVAVPVPGSADIVVLQERLRPAPGIDDVAVPLDQQNERGGQVAA